MSIRLKELLSLLENFAPLSLAEEWDNSGLLLGEKEKVVEKIMLCLDVTPEVVSQAKGAKIDLILSHHPVIFAGLKNLCPDNWHTRLLCELIKEEIAVYSAHTNLDITSGGVSDVLAQKCGLANTKILAVTAAQKLYKVAVFVPVEYSEQVITAMTSNGAGQIGAYSDCSFSTEGTGRFRPLAGSSPFIGEQNKLEVLPELKIEAIVPAGKRHQVVQALLKAHPYEEVAHDVYPLDNTISSWGIGQLGELPASMPTKEFAMFVKEKLALNHVVYADAGKQIKKVAIVGGSGSDFIKAALEQGADALVTGDVKYHVAQEAKFAGLTVVDAGHQGTELPILEVLEEKLNTWLQGLDIKITRAKEQAIFQQI